MSKQPKVAIVHDWLIGGGAEKVVEALHEMYPQAPIYTSYCSKEWRKRLNNKVVTGPLQHWPFSMLRKFLPVLRIWWFQSLQFDQYDLVISSSGAEAKGIKVPSHVKHIAYIHAPTHYYWSRYDDYLKNPGFIIFDPLARIGLKILVGPLRKWDYKAAQRPDKLIANSTHIQAEIKKYYKRDSVVVFPPVDVERFHPKQKTEREGFVIAARQVPYKRVDLAVQACSELNVPLTVIGKGPEHKKLKKLAGPSITFVSKASDKDIVNALQQAKGFIFPGVDDFGIVAIEALAAGCPVIAYKGGGALDYIQPGKNGLLFNKQTVGSLSNALQEFSKLSFRQVDCIESSQQFSKKSFQKIQDYL